MLRIGEMPKTSGWRRSRIFVQSTLVAALSILLAGTTAAGQQRATFRIVVHESNPESSLTVEQLGEVFRKEVVQWAGGPPVVPVDLPVTSPVRESFSQTVHGRPGAAIDAYWRRQVFSGRGSPPVVLDSDAEVLAYLAENPNAIGYVSMSTPLRSGVKAVQIEQAQAGAVYSAGVVDQRPVGMSRPDLRYPRELLSQRVEGQVRLEFTIDERGRVDPSTIAVVSSSHDGFIEPARDMIEGSRYRPGRMAGEAVAVIVQQTVRFSLNN